MRPVALLGALGTAAACTGQPPPPATPCNILWQRDVVGFFENWCTPCHGSNVPPEWRQGAPVGLDFDTLAGVRRNASRIAETSLAAEPRMPPAGGPREADREVVRRWIECGMPGTEIPEEVDPCAGARAVGEASLATASDADALCADGPVAITGGLTVTGDAVADCVCRVDGDLSVTGGTRVRLGQLATVGGGLAVGSVGALELPMLEQVGGAVEIGGARTPDEVLLPELRAVGGDFLAQNLAGTRRMDLSRLREVGGALVVAAAPRLGDLWAPRVAVVGGDVRFEDLPSLSSVETVQSLHQVPGDLVIARTGVTALDDMRSYERIGGTLEIRDNPSLASIDGFWLLEEVGTVRIVDNPALTAVEGFDVLGRAGELVVSGDAVQLLTVPALATVDGALRLEGLPALTQLSAELLTDVGGDLSLQRAQALPSLVRLSALRTIGGSLTLAELGVTTVSPLASIERVGADLTIRDNPALPTANAEALAAAIESIGGEVVITGNAP